MDALESESLHILREAAACARNPVLLYSIGKDSSVLLHLARKAFYPATPPFPLLHVDTTWKFRAMYEHRERMARESGLRLIVHTNEAALAEGINPFTHGSSYYPDVMKTEALKQALDAHGFDIIFGGARRDEEASRAKSGSARSARPAIAGIRRRSGPSCGTSSTCASIRARRSGCFRFPTGPSSTSGATSSASACRSSRCTSRPNGWSSSAAAR
jgi:hypothetical protein